MISKPKKEKKKDKKEKQKKPEIQEAEEGVEDQQKSIKSSIFSMLDEIDAATKEESRATEEKLRRGLIERTTAERSEEIKNKELRISEIKKEIEKLKGIKQNYYDKGDNIKTIEISKKIIDLATKYDMLFIATEEKTFVDQVQNKIIETPKKSISEQIENLKKIRHAHYARKKYGKAIDISNKIIDLATKENLISVVREEKKFISLMKDKINAKTSGKKMLETLNVEDAKESQIERDTVKEKVLGELGIKKIGGKDKIEEKRQKLEEEKQKFEVEKQNFKEEKEAFDWEKQMFEEVKKFEQDKVKEDTTKDRTKQDSKIIINEEIEKFEKDKSEFGEQKELFEQEKQKFRDIEEQIKQEKLKLEEGKEKFKQEKLELEEKKNLLEKNWLKFEEKKNKLKQEQQKLEEEKETFKWEKQMLEEVKKFEAEKDSS